MANTFYQYGKRDAIQYTDWSKISENFSTMISEELTRREDKKAEIQEATNEAMKFINDNPVGAYSLANDFSVAHANNAQEYLLMLDKKLKTGALNPKDFVMMRENLKTGTEGIYKVATAYQKRFEEVEKDLLSGDPQLSNLTYARMIALEGLGRLENTDALIDVASGRVNLSKYDVVDGVKNYTEGYTTNEAMAFMQTDIKRFKVRDNVKKAVDSLGTLKEAYFQEAERYGGFNVLKEKVNMRDDSELKGVKEGYQKWREDTINSFMNDINQASILVDFLEGEGYEAVTNKSDFDNDKTGKLIYIAPNGETEFQEGQKERAREAFTTQLDNAIDQEYTEKGAGYKQYPTSRGTGGRGTKYNARQSANYMSYLRGGNEQQIAAARTYFKNLMNQNKKKDEPRVLDIIRTDEGVTVLYEGNRREELPFVTGGVELTMNDWVGSSSPLLTGETNVLQALEEGFVFDVGDEISTFDRRFETTQPQTSREKVNTYISNEFANVRTGNKQELGLDLRRILGDLGFDVSYRGFNNTVDISLGGFKRTINLANDIQAQLDDLAVSLDRAIKSELMAERGQKERPFTNRFASFASNLSGDTEEEEEEPIEDTDTEEDTGDTRDINTEGY